MTVKALAPIPVSHAQDSGLNMLANYDGYYQVLVNVISGGLTPSFTCKEAEDMGAKVISMFFYLYSSRRT